MIHIVIVGVLTGAFIYTIYSSYIYVYMHSITAFLNVLKAYHLVINVHIKITESTFVLRVSLFAV